MPIATSGTVSLQSLITNPSVMNIPEDDYEEAKYRRKQHYTYRSHLTDEDDEGGYPDDSPVKHLYEEPDEGGYPGDNRHKRRYDEPATQGGYHVDSRVKRKYENEASTPGGYPVDSRRKRQYDSAVATMLAPSKYPVNHARSFVEFALTPQWTQYDREDDGMDELPVMSRRKHESENHSDSPHGTAYYEEPKRTAWGRPRGRRTIQDKIAEQNQRAAALEQELRAVGLAAAPTTPQPSPSLARLGKPGTGSARKKTVAVSVIRRSPAVGLPLAARSSTGSAVSEDSGYAPPSFVRDAPLYPRMMLVPGMMVRVDRPGGEPLYIPHSLDTVGPVFKTHPNDVVSHSRAHAFNRHLSLPPALPRTSPTPSSPPLREERLSTKLKRIQAKAGAAADESPRGFLSQKIETLRRRESSLQQEFEEVISRPIAPNGVTSAQELLQERFPEEEGRSVAGEERNTVLYHMLNQAGVESAERAWRKKRRHLNIE